MGRYPKIPDAIEKEIIKLVKKEMPHDEIAKKFGIHPTTIYGVMARWNRKQKFTEVKK